MATDSLQWLRPLYEQASPIALAVARRIVHCPAEAEDILQDAFVAAVPLRKSYDARRGSELAWLLSIVRGKALDRLRALAIRRVAADEIRQAPEDPLQEADSMGNARVMRGLGVLSTQQKTAVELAYFSGLTHVEIAERMDAPLGSVKTWLRLGLLQLAAELSPRDAAAGG